MNVEQGKAQGVMPMAQGVVMAQPAVPTAQAVPMAAAMPMASAMPNDGSRVQFTPGQGYTPTVPEGNWASDLFDCCGDGGMCWAACCCPFLTGPQLYQRVTGEPGSCRKWASILVTLYVLSRIASTLQQVSPRGSSLGPIYLGANAGLTVALYAISAWVLTVMRKRIRFKDEIGVGGCGEAEDCCCSFWCSCCVTVQAFRQLEMSCQNGYQLCAEEGVANGGGGPQV